MIDELVKDKSYSENFVEKIQKILENLNFVLGLVHVPEIEQDKKDIECFIKQLKDAGAVLDDLKIQYFSKVYRGIFLTNSKQDGDTIAFIPDEFLITCERAFSTPTNKQIAEKNFNSQIS